MLEVLVGPIASGKSTYARSRAKQGAVIVNDDAIGMALHGGDYSLYDESLKPLYKAIETTIVMTALTMGRDVIVDRPCHRRSTRRRYVELARSIDTPAVATLFKHEEAGIHAQRRVESDPRGRDFHYWLKVALSHESVFQPVTDDEGFDNIVPSDVAIDFQSGD